MTGVSVHFNLMDLNWVGITCSFEVFVFNLYIRWFFECPFYWYESPYTPVSLLEFTYIHLLYLQSLSVLMLVSDISIVKAVGCFLISNGMVVHCI